MIMNFGFDPSERQRIMALLAQADPKVLSHAWERLAEKPVWRFMRHPEAGLIMIRGRAGGGGAPFNLGEATVTRCAVALESGEIGHSVVLGRDTGHARLAACLDALWQRATSRTWVEAEIVAPLSAEQDAADQEVREETAATRVEFFTMVRGEDT